MADEIEKTPEEIAAEEEAAKEATEKEQAEKDAAEAAEKEAADKEAAEKEEAEKNTSTVAAPALKYMGKRIVNSGTRTVNEVVYQHVVLEDGTTHDLTEEQYRTDVTPL